MSGKEAVFLRAFYFEILKEIDCCVKFDTSIVLFSDNQSSHKIELAIQYLQTHQTHRRSVPLYS